MSFHKVKRVAKKKSKNGIKEYTYYELHKVFRDPDNKERVITQYICYLGTDPNNEQARERIQRAKDEFMGKYATNRLIKKIERELSKEEKVT